MNRYKVVGQPGLINYRDFINKLDTVFSESADQTAVIQNARSSAVSFILSHPFGLNPNMLFLNRNSMTMR